MGDYGLKIAPSGESINSADKLLAFTSKYYLFKSVLQGTTTLTIPGGGTQSNTASIAHGLGYAPMFLVYADAGSAKRYLCHVTGYGSGAANQIDRNIYSWSDSTNLKFFIHFGTPGSYTAYYYIFYDPVV